MRFSTETVTRCTARLGKLTEIERLPNLSFETPMLTLYTRRGCVPHLTKDVFKMLTKEQEFLTASLPSTLFMADFVKEFKSFNEFIGMQEYPVFLTIQDPCEETNPGYQKKDSIAIWTRNGGFAVNPTRYMNVVETFKPDMYTTLADSDTDANSTNKRIAKSLERSKFQFEQCLEKHLESNVLKNKGFLGSVQGGYDLLAREKSIKYMEGKPLLGYVIEGLHRNGKEVRKINTDQVKTVIEHSLNLLPVEGLKVLMGCWHPSVILDLVDLGIDLFDSSYPCLLVEEAKALTFLCDECQEKSEKEYIYLFEKRYIDDFTPICKSCQCLTCKNHTKAYIHHLLLTKELLALVLLTIHNTHHYMEFFKAIRHNIKNKTFSKFKHKMQSRLSIMNGTC